MMPFGTGPDEPSVDGILRRQGDERRDYTAFVGRPRRSFPAQAFFDVATAINSRILAAPFDRFDEAASGKKLETYDPRYYGTYYAIEAIISNK